MKNYLYSVISLISAVLIAPEAYSAIQMTSTNNVEVGEVYSDFTNTNEYHFVNNGTTTVNVVRLIPTCPCILATNDVDIVKPGETMKVIVFFDARTISGKFSRGLWLITNDPDNKQILLRVSGEVIPLFKGFPDERIDLMAKDKSIALTNKFTFAATTTNYFLGHPQCEELTNCISFEWKAEKFEGTNIWHLTTVIQPDDNMSKSAAIRIPVTGPIARGDHLIRLKLTVGVELRAVPSKLVTTTLTQPFTKKFYINASIPDGKTELLTWEPQITGIKVDKALPAPRRGLSSSKFKRPLLSSRSKTRFECAVSMTPAALQELMQMEEPGITFSYPDHQPTTIPLILYNPAF